MRVTDADGYSWTYDYDEFDRLMRDTDRAGLSFCFRYDNKDRGIEAWGEYVGTRDPSLADDLVKFLADGRTRAKGIYHRKLDYHADGYTEVTDTTETRRYFGNKKGMLEKAVAGGAVTSSRYDGHGFEIAKTDPVGATTRWVRDERGRVLEEIDPLERRTQISRDSYGLPIQIVDPAGGVTRAHRDRKGNFEEVQDAEGGTRLFSHDERGLFQTLTDPTGATTRFAHDSHGNLAQTVEANGGRWTFAYDWLGRRLSVRDPAGCETRYTYSARGDLVAVYDADGGVTRYRYDGERHLVQVVSPKGHATHFVWGGYHQLCARRDANGHSVRFAYNREGELIQVFNQREEVHNITRNHAGRIVEEQTFDDRIARYRYDLAGRIVRIENGEGQATSSTYDLAGQMVERTLPDETTETFEYNARAELVQATNSAGVFLFERDALGRIVREVQRVGDEEHWVELRYDKAGNRTGRRTSLGHTEAVARDGMGARLTTILDGASRIDHTNDLLAREVGRKLPVGGVIESAFTPAGRLAQRIATSPSPARRANIGEPEWIGRRDDGVTAKTSYAYDPDGELVSKSDLMRGQTRYEYNPVGQLMAAIPDRVLAELFRYDAAGNVYDNGSEGPARVYGKGNRIERRGESEYEWDGNGRLIRRVVRNGDGAHVWSYAWNGAGLLESVRTPDDRIVDFAYDPLARRVGKRIRVRDAIAWKVVHQTRSVGRRRYRSRDPC